MYIYMRIIITDDFRRHELEKRKCRRAIQHKNRSSSVATYRFCNCDRRGRKKRDLDVGKRERAHTSYTLFNNTC